MLFAFDTKAIDSVVCKTLIAVALLTVITVIHASAERRRGLKVGLVIFMICAGIYVVVFHLGRTQSEKKHILNWQELWQGSAWSVAVIATSLFKVFYSYAGLDSANNVFNNVQNPIWTLKITSTEDLVTAMVLYSLINDACYLVVPINEIKPSAELIAGLISEHSFGPNVGKKV